MSDLKADLRQFVIDTFLFGQDNGLANDSSFLAEGIVDSTGVLELVAHLESTYGFKVTDDELTPDNLDSIDAIAAYIATKRTSAGPAA